MMKKMVLILVIMGMISVFGTNAGAANAWYPCTIHFAGPALASGAVYFGLTHNSGTPAFANRTFKAIAGAEKTMLAVGLTAVASDMVVNIRTDLALYPPPAIPVIDIMYLIK